MSRRDQACRVLFISASGSCGGAELSLLGLLRHLDRKRFTPFLALPRRDASAFLDYEARRLGIDVFAVNLPRLRRTWNPASLAAQFVGLRRAGGELAHICRETGINLIHANTVPAALFAAKAREELGPVAAPALLWHQRDLDTPQPVRTLLLEHVTRALPVSGTVGRKLAEWFPKDRLEVHYPGVELAPFSDPPGRRDARKALGLPQNVPIALYAANLTPWKRHDLFLWTVAELKKDLPNIVGIMAGSHIHAPVPGKEILSDNPHLMRLAEHLGISENIICGAYDPIDMPTLYGAVDILIHLAEGEPFGRTIVEALASGVPVVASAGGGPAEILSTGGGIVVTDKSPAAAAKAALYYLKPSEDQLAADISESSPSLDNLEQFSAKYASQRLMDALDSVLDS